mgnify:CR=1 FL=1
MMPRTTTKAHHHIVTDQHKKALRLGLVAGLVAGWSHRPRPDITRADLRRHDYSASTQRLGVRFTERIRDVFRFRWIREIL